MSGTAFVSKICLQSRNQNDVTIIEDSSEDEFAPTQRIDARRVRL